MFSPELLGASGVTLFGLVVGVEREGTLSGGALVGGGEGMGATRLTVGETTPKPSACSDAEAFTGGSAVGFDGGRTASFSPAPTRL